MEEIVFGFFDVLTKTKIIHVRALPAVRIETHEL
jgi:hypothetical protein